MKIVQVGLDFYRWLPLEFLATYPVRRPPAALRHYGARAVEEQRARNWFEGWCAERGFAPEFVS